MKRVMWFVLIVLVVGISFFAKKLFVGYEAPSVKTTNKKVVELLIATGRFTAHRNSNIGFEVAGVLVERLVEEGDKVKLGQVVARLNNQEILAQVAAAEVAVVLATHELERAMRPTLPEDLERLRAAAEAAKVNTKQALLEVNRAEKLGEFGNEADRDLANTKLEQARLVERQRNAELALALRVPLKEEKALAEAQLSNAKANLAHVQVLASKRELRAPFDGLVIKQFTEIGVSIPIGSPVFRITETSNPEILVDTDEGNLGRLKRGQLATVTAQGFPGFSFKAVLDRIGPNIDNQRGVVPLMLIPNEVPQWVLFDMTVDVCIETARFENAITLPPTAVVEKAGKVWVVVEENGVAKFKYIKILGHGRDGLALEGIESQVSVAIFASGIVEGTKLRLVEKP